MNVIPKIIEGFSSPVIRSASFVVLKTAGTKRSNLLVRSFTSFRMTGNTIFDHLLQSFSMFLPRPFFFNRINRIN